MAVSFRYAVHTDLGTVRTNNEDSALGSPRLLALADGMGGHAAGEVASAVALRVFSEIAQGPGVDAATQLVRAGRATRRALHDMSESEPMLESMGTTLVAVAGDGERFVVGHIGDSRVYALRGGSLYQVTTDHTHVQRLIDSGQLTPERARTHPYRSMLLKSLDDQAGGADLDIIEIDLRPGDRLLLCSDGLSDYVSPEHIGEVLCRPERDEAARGLIEAALLVGTRDNVTVVVADVVSGPDAEGAALLEPPVFAGAVRDGITLSPDAATAMGAALPDILIHAAEPSAGARVQTPAPEGAVTGQHVEDHQDEMLDCFPASEAPARRAEGEPAEPGEQVPDGSPEPVQAREPVVTGEPVVATTPHPPGIDPPGVPAGPVSRVPGVLAGAAAVVLAVLVWVVGR